MSDTKFTVGVVVPAQGNDFKTAPSFDKISLRMAALDPPSVTSVSCSASNSQVFVDGEYCPYMCALEFSSKHLVARIPVMSQWHEMHLEQLRRARNFRVVIRGTDASGALIAVVDETLSNFRFDRLNYSWRVADDSPFWVAELRFVAPLTAVAADEKAA